MCKLRDFLIFAAGAEFFHTLSHILLPYFIQLPIDMKIMDFTHQLNWWSIIANGLITIVLLLWAKKITKK